MLTVYKASAGSGKTFHLVLEYLKLIMSDDRNYRKILAVTFTNKATAEMKSRILEQLYKLAHGFETQYFSLLKEHLRISETEISIRAKRILKNILFGFNYFSVSTIDKFTQKVIKAFNREIGIPADYNIEMDNDILLLEIVDRLIANADINPELIDWLVKLSSEKIQENLNYNFEKDLTELGKELFREKFQNLLSEMNHTFPDKKTLKEGLNALNQVIGRFESSVKARAEYAINLIEEKNLTESDFSRGKSGPAGYFYKLAGGIIEKPRKIDLISVESPGKWYTQSGNKKSVIHELAIQVLIPVAKEVIGYFQKNQKEYFTAIEARKNLYTLGLLIDMKLELDRIRYEKNILPISDSNNYLNKIIEGSDSPFIYEKTGNRYHHFMLDEFQDTSVLQWENFLPLIKNSLSNGYSNLVVGDVKQSIYRWRNSDWKILASGIYSDLPPDQLETRSLQKNWRSREKIIEFNNNIFPLISNVLSQKIASAPEIEETPVTNDRIELLKLIYEDVEQRLPEDQKKTGGLVEITLIDEKLSVEFENKSMEILLEQVKRLLDHGYQSSEIAILIRKKQDGAKIVNYFLQEAEKEENIKYNLAILSNESLFLKNSNAVQFIILLIRHFINPEEKLIKAGLVHLLGSYIIPELRKTETALEKKNIREFLPFFQGEVPGIIPGFHEKFNDLFKFIEDIIYPGLVNNSTNEAIIKICAQFSLFDLEKELPYILGLIDRAKEIITNRSGDFSGFLRWWDEKNYDLSITLNEKTDAIRLLTIHAAKGLEFEAVLLPFFTWSVSHPNSSSPVLWCRSEVLPYKNFGFIPVKFTKRLSETYFAEEYFDELISNAVDNLNLIYVAFTRAKSALFINTMNKGNSDTAGNLLTESLAVLRNMLTFVTNNNSGYNCISFGTHIQVPEKTTEKPGPGISSGRFKFTDFNQKLRLHQNSQDFLETLEGEKPVKNLGKLIHEILSEISLANQVDNALKKFLAEKKVTPEEYNSLKEWLSRLVNSVEAGDWFKGNYSVMNERNILSSDGILRPDRIMVNQNRAIVVDYKLGEIRSEEYTEQVNKYSRELKKCGFESVSGYLWYIRDNKVEKVCDF